MRVIGNSNLPHPCTVFLSLCVVLASSEETSFSLFTLAAMQSMNLAGTNAAPRNPLSAFQNLIRNLSPKVAIQKKEVWSHDLGLPFDTRWNIYCPLHRATVPCLSLSASST